MIFRGAAVEKRSVCADFEKNCGQNQAWRPPLTGAIQRYEKTLKFSLKHHFFFYLCRYSNNKWLAKL